MEKIRDGGRTALLCLMAVSLVMLAMACGDSTERPQVGDVATPVGADTAGDGVVAPEESDGSLDQYTAAVDGDRALPGWEALLAGEFDDADVLSVVGSGRAERRNDRGELWVAVATEGFDYGVTGVELHDLLAEVTELLVFHGMKSENIETMSAIVVNKADKGESRFAGSGLLRVYLHHPDLATSVAAGIYSRYVDGEVALLTFTFMVDDLFDLEREARGRAVAQMEARARKLASGSGKRLGRLLALSEPPLGERVELWALRDRFGLTSEFVASSGMHMWEPNSKAVSDVPVNFGKTEHEVQVQGVYELLER